MFRRMGSEMLLRDADKGAGSGGAAVAGGMPAAVKPGSDGGDGGAQQPGNSGTGAAPGVDAMSIEQALAELEKAKRMLKEANSESAGRRKRLEELEAAEQARQQAQMSDAEKAAAAAETLKQELAARDAQIASLQQAAVRYEVMLEAQKLGIIDLDAAHRLLDPQALEFGEDGKPTNVEAALKALVKEKPYLVRQEAKSSGVGTPPQKPRTPAQNQAGVGTRRVTPL